MISAGETESDGSKPYAALSFAGRLRRLRVLASGALDRYELRQPEITYYGWRTNLLYRITEASGERYMLRLASPGWRTLADLQAEAMWLNALARDTDIQAPRAIPARSGEHVLPLAGPGVPDVRNATLMSWVPGRLLGYCLNRGNLAKMGALFAGLHHHGASWPPPAEFTARRFEHWLSRGEENLIAPAGDPAVGTAPEREAAGLPVPHRRLLLRLHEQVESAYAAVDRGDLRVIHCDLWHGNIKLHRGVLYPFDFEDTVWGFRAHDIAMAMLDLLEATGDERYPELLAAFRRGYEAHASWPENRIEPFQIGRLLWRINWFAYRRPGRLAAVVESHVPMLEHYVRTGLVVRPPVL